MPLEVTVTRRLCVPDRLRTARCLHSPELGPKVLFFSGGTALRPLAREIIRYTHNSIHLITPFDSGGSSAKLRAAFSMLAVGDIRNRLMALADRSLHGNPEIFRLFAYRFPKTAGALELKARLRDMAEGRDGLVRAVPEPMREIILAHLRVFLQRMPGDFDLRGASIGNLILTGGCFSHDGHIDPVIYLFTKLVEARGVVRPTINRDLHLVAELNDGRVLVGQHLLTGKETAPIASPVRRVWLAENADNPEPVEAPIADKVRSLISSADLICYPIGSFYSSVVANLLPKGVGDAVARTGCPKIYIPNPCGDPEMTGMSLVDAVGRLVYYLRKSAGSEVPVDRLLNFVLLDSENSDYGAHDIEAVRRLGVEVLDTRLTLEQTRPRLNETRLIEHLVSLA